LPNRPERERQETDDVDKRLSLDKLKDERYVEAHCPRRRMDELDQGLSVFERKMTRAGLLDAFKLGVPGYVAWLASRKAHLDRLDAEIAAREPQTTTKPA
jgi:hypothetical protein